MKQDTEVVSKVGEIEIRVFRVSDGTPIPGDLKNDISASLSTSVHEKALKGQAKSHTIS